MGRSVTFEAGSGNAEDNLSSIVVAVAAVGLNAGWLSRQDFTSDAKLSGIQL